MLYVSRPPTRRWHNVGGAITDQLLGVSAR
jgi:hypothetical protein